VAETTAVQSSEGIERRQGKSNTENQNNQQYFNLSVEKWSI